MMGLALLFLLFQAPPQAPTQLRVYIDSCAVQVYKQGQIIQQVKLPSGDAAMNNACWYVFRVIQQ